MMRRIAVRLAAEAGEGVISTAIAVLIMALLGVAMWAAFDQIFGKVTDRIDAQIDSLGAGVVDITSIAA
ncbi:MAG: hypothetical protein ACRD0K_08990 [Egibacteraceae bacterium]